MPTIDLGQVRPMVIDNLTSTDTRQPLSAAKGKELFDQINILYEQGFTQYMHSKTGNKHQFTGKGKLGFCKCNAIITTEDRIEFNGEEINNWSHETIQEGTWIVFTIDTLEDDTKKIILFNKILNIPDGTTVLPVNDMELWFACAGLGYNTYNRPSAEQIKYNKPILTALFESYNAVQYFTRSSELIGVLINSPVLNEILDQSIWTTISPLLKASVENGYEVVAADAMMTSGASNYGAWGDYTIAGPYKATDAATVNRFTTLKVPTPIWPYKIKGLWGFNDTAVAGQWKFEASVDNEHWVTLQDSTPFTHIALSGFTTAALGYQPHTMYNSTKDTGKYSYFKITCTNKNGGTYIDQVQGCQIYGIA